jgi:hypothetical protein
MLELTMGGKFYGCKGPRRKHKAVLNKDNSDTQDDIFAAVVIVLRISQVA